MYVLIHCLDDPDCFTGLSGQWVLQSAHHLKPEVSVWVHLLVQATMDLQFMIPHETGWSILLGDVVPVSPDTLGEVSLVLEGPHPDGPGGLSNVDVLDPLVGWDPLLLLLGVTQCTVQVALYTMLSKEHFP